MDFTEGWKVIICTFTQIDAIVAPISAIVTTIGIVFVVWQLVEMRRATQGQNFAFVVEQLQNEKVRKARRTVFQELEEKPLESWDEIQIEAFLSERLRDGRKEANFSGAN